MKCIFERFVVNVDASGKGIAGCVLQQDENGELRPVTFSKSIVS